MNKILFGIVAGFIISASNSFAQGGYTYPDDFMLAMPRTSSASVSRTSEDDVIINDTKLGDVNVVTRGKCPSPTFEKASYEDLTPEYYKNRDYVLTNKKDLGQNICQYIYYLKTTDDDRYHPGFGKFPR